MEKRKYYSGYEKEVFKELVMKEPHLLNNTTLRGSALRDEKSLAWDRVMKEFNSIPRVNQVSTYN